MYIFVYLRILIYHYVYLGLRILVRVETNTEKSARWCAGTDNWHHCWNSSKHFTNSSLSLKLVWTILHRRMLIMCTELLDTKHSRGIWPASRHVP